MSDERHATHVVVVKMSELETRRSEATSALAAYVRAEQTKTFRQLLWRRLALAAAGWSLLGLLHVIPVSGVVVGLTLFILIAAGVAVLEHRAGREALDRVTAASEHDGG